MPSHAERQKKYLAKLKGCIGEARKSSFDTRERQRMAKMLPRTEKGW